MPRQAPSLADRLWARVDSSPGPFACWPWTGATQNGGYGVIGIGRAKLLLTHRVAFENKNGFMPTVVMHSCDNRLCCNPAHLVAGTQRDNCLDMARKGRSTSPLTEAQARQILADPRPHRIIAKDYGVSHNTVGRIKRKQEWSWL